MYRLLMVRYGELGLKGKNKSQFINRLVKNINYALTDIDTEPAESTWGRVMVPIDHNLPQVLERLQRVFGIYSMSPVLQVEKEMPAICQGAYQMLLQALPQGGSFKVESRRSDKRFPLTSPEISKQAAAYIFDQVGENSVYQADMHHPQNVIQIEVREEGAYVYGCLLYTSRCV